MPVLVVGALTVLAFALRLPGVGQSLFLDEPITLVDVRGQGLAGVFQQIRPGESVEVTPPLYFLLAWMASKMGDPTVWIRAPSLLFGTATVPLVYLLGVRTVGRTAALVASALVTLSPFAVFYSAEARAYAVLTFFAAASALALLLALDTGRRRWWVAYGVCSSAVLYTHYTGVFVLGAGAAWAFWYHRDRRRELLLVNAAVALSFVPWLFTGASSSADHFGGPLDFSVYSFVQAFWGIFPGQPFTHLVTLIPFRDLPGTVPVALFCAAVAVGLGGRLAPIAVARRKGRPWVPPKRTIGLIALLALATPLGVLVYSLTQHDIFVSRFLSASMPAAALLTGWLLTSMRPGLVVATVLVALGATGIGTVKSFQDDYRRPPVEDAAQFIERQGRSADSVVALSVGLTSGPSPGDFSHAFRSGFHRAHPPIYDAVPGASAGWARGARGGRVFLAFHAFGGLQRPPPRSGPGNRFQLQATRIYPGVFPVVVGVYGLSPPAELRRIDAPVVASEWGAGFSATERGGPSAAAVRRTGQLRVVNWSGTARSVTLIGRLSRAGQGRSTALFQYPDGTEQRVTISGASVGWRHTLRLAPGPNAVTVSTSGPAFRVAGDPKAHYLDIGGFGLQGGQELGLPPLRCVEGRRVTSPDAGQTRITRRDGRELIVSSFGKEVAVARGAVDGSIDSISTLTSRVLIVTGWAADTARDRLADRVLLFDDGRLLKTGRPTKDRPDIAEALGDRLTRSGFVIAAVTDQADEIADDPSRLRVFAAVGNRASELEASEQAKKAVAERCGRI